MTHVDDASDEKCIIKPIVYICGSVELQKVRHMIQHIEDVLKTENMAS